MELKVHGFWMLGAVLILAGSFLAGQIEFVEGTTTASYAISIIIAFVLILAGGSFWITSSLNAE